MNQILLEKANMYLRQADDTDGHSCGQQHRAVALILELLSEAKRLSKKIDTLEKRCETCDYGDIVEMTDTCRGCEYNDRNNWTPKES